MPSKTRKKKTEVLIEPEPRYRIRIGKDQSGRLYPTGYESGGETRWMNERRLEEVAVVDVGRPFTFHVPSVSRGPSGFVFEGMTGENAKPWSASQVLAAARHKQFGFSLVVG